MEADIHTLYGSDFYRVLDFKCRCTHCRTSAPEYSGSFCISFVRKGNFQFNVYRNSLDSYTGCVLVSKPGYERTVTHTHTRPDECTIFDFTGIFYDEIKETHGSLRFLFDNDLHTSLVQAGAAAEVLHRTALAQIAAGHTEKLKMDSMVVEIMEHILGKLSDLKSQNPLPASLKKHHLATVEAAKEYMLLNYQRDISLLELSRHCHVSPFHFSRIFKKITSCPPHRFLTAVRLKNSELLVKETAAPIVDIALQSGFNSVEHFTSSFTREFGVSPAAYRAII